MADLVLVVLGRGDPLDQEVEEGLEARARGPLLHGGPARLGVGVDDGELDLLEVGVEVEEQLVDLVDDFLDAGVGPVDLVDDQDHRQLRLQGLA
jgi:hypothetical protein